MLSFVAMTRAELLTYISQIEDPRKEYSKILANIHYTHFFLMDKYKKMLHPYDLTVTQSNVLGIINHYNPHAVSLETIKEMVLEPNSDVSRTVARLVDKGFAEKIANTTNRRKVSIRATSKGLAVLKELENDPGLREITASLSLSEADSLVKMLSTLRAE